MQTCKYQIAWPLPTRWQLLLLGTLLTFKAWLAQAQNNPTAEPTPTGQTETAAPPLPAVSVMPWRMLAVDPARVAPQRQVLTTSLRSLVDAIIDTPKPLTTLAAEPSAVPLNTRRLSEQIWTGALKDNPGQLVPLAIEATWSTILDQDVITVTVADAARNVLLGSAHTAIARSQIDQGGMAGFLSGKLNNLAQTALAQARAHPQADPNFVASDALHLGISLGQQITRQDVGSSHALSLLLEEGLAPNYTVVRALGSDRLATIAGVLERPDTLRRPTRMLVSRWQGNFNSSRNPKLPTKLRLSATIAESVHGEQLPDRHQSEWDISIKADGQIAAPLAPDLLALLDREKKSLLLQDLPQAVKVDRAWVYVDRGRAWGLKIGDRLLARLGPNPDDIVKGHIVQYFGPELKLQSQRGFAIQEGSIVFIRKNQSKTRPGMLFEFDPKTFPAAWPPSGP